MNFFVLDLAAKRAILKDLVTLFFKAIPIGIANTLPGISGGTIALVLKIYDRLINSIKKIKIKELISVALGAVVGIWLAAKLIAGLLDSSPNLMLAFLMGLILTSSKVTISEIKDYNFKSVGLILLGFIVAYFFAVDMSLGPTFGTSNFSFFIGGVLSSSAMIIPGISGGTLLAMLGLYEAFVQAVDTFDVARLFIIAAGMGVGIMGFAWPLSYLLKNYRSLLMALMTGLILGSVRSVIPASFGFGELLALLLGSGVVLIFDLGVEQN